MCNKKKSVKLALAITYIFAALLVFIVIALPGIVTWYVEYRGKAASLPTTIMLTCYPCVPFVGYALWALRALLKNILADKVFCKENITQMNRLTFCAFAIMLIMVISGRFYLPFFVSAICSGFMGLIVMIVKNLFEAALPKENAEEVEEAKNNISKDENI